MLEVAFFVVVRGRHGTWETAAVAIIIIRHVNVSICAPLNVLMLTAVRGIRSSQMVKLNNLTACLRFRVAVSCVKLPLLCNFSRNQSHAIALQSIADLTTFFV